MNLFNQEFISITGVIELIYFNENHPENHYFCTTNLDSYYSSVYNTEKKTVDKDRKKYLFDKILYDNIECLYANNIIKSQIGTKCTAKVSHA